MVGKAEQGLTYTIEGVMRATGPEAVPTVTLLSSPLPVILESTETLRTVLCEELLARFSLLSHPIMISNPESRDSSPERSWKFGKRMKKRIIHNLIGPLRHNTEEDGKSDVSRRQKRVQQMGKACSRALHDVQVDRKTTSLR